MLSFSLAFSHSLAFVRPRKNVCIFITSIKNHGKKQREQNNHVWRLRYCHHHAWFSPFTSYVLIKSTWHDQSTCLLRPPHFFNYYSFSTFFAFFMSFFSFFRLCFMAPIFYKTINDVVSSDSRKFLPLFIYFTLKKKRTALRAYCLPFANFRMTRTYSKSETRSPSERWI